MTKFLNSAQAKADTEAEQAAEQAEVEQQMAEKVNDLRQALANLQELLDATGTALSEAYVTIQSQAVEIAMLERRLAKRMMEKNGLD